MILTAVPPKNTKGAKGRGNGFQNHPGKIWRLIAAGQNAQRDVEGKPQTVQSVTLLLTPEQAERVALAHRRWKNSAALRNPMDKEAAEPPLVVRSDLYIGPTMENAKINSAANTLPEKSAAKGCFGIESYKNAKSRKTQSTKHP